MNLLERRKANGICRCDGTICHIKETSHPVECGPTPSKSSTGYKEEERFGDQGSRPGVLDWKGSERKRRVSNPRFSTPPASQLRNSRQGRTAQTDRRQKYFAASLWHNKPSYPTTCDDCDTTWVSHGTPKQGERTLLYRSDQQRV